MAERNEFKKALDEHVAAWIAGIAATGDRNDVADLRGLRAAARDHRAQIEAELRQAWRALESGLDERERTR